MQVNRDALHFWCGLVSRVVPSDKSAEPLDKAVIITKDGVLLSNNNYHALHLSTLDVEGAFSDEVEIPMVAVSAADLYHATDGLDDKDMVDLEVTGDATLKVVTTRRSYELDIVESTAFQFPKLEAESVSHGSAPKGKIVEALQRAIPFTSNEPVKPYLMGVMFMGNSVYATNQTQGVRFGWDTLAFPEGINFIPDAVMHALKTGGGEDTEVFITSDEKWVLFQFGPIAVYSRRWSTKGEFKTAAIDQLLNAGKGQAAFIEMEAESLQNAVQKLKYFATEGFIWLEAHRTQGITLKVMGKKRAKAKAEVSGMTNKGSTYVFVLAEENIESLLKTGIKQLKLCVGDPQDAVYLEHAGLEYFALPVIE